MEKALKSIYNFDQINICLVCKLTKDFVISLHLCPIALLVVDIICFFFFIHTKNLIFCSVAVRIYLFWRGAYLKRIIFTLILISLLAALCSACGGQDDDVSAPGKPNRTAIEFSDADDISTLEAEWLFIPEGAELLHSMSWDDKLEYDFTAVGYVEINAYIKALYTAMKEKGFLPLSYRFDRETCKLTDFAELETPPDTVEDESFSGTAYEFLYKTESKFYMLTVKYYGSAGGTYGNGKALVTLEDITGYAAQCYKEFYNE